MSTSSVEEISQKIVKKVSAEMFRERFNVIKVITWRFVKRFHGEMVQNIADKVRGSMLPEVFDQALKEEFARVWDEENAKVQKEKDAIQKETIERAFKLAQKEFAQVSDEACVKVQEEGIALKDIEEMCLKLLEDRFSEYYKLPPPK